MPSVEVNGVRINYLRLECEAGDDCEDLVMIHGLATSLAFWYFSHAPAFSKRYRITLYDLRGHGRSGMTGSGYSPGNMALDLQGLLDHLSVGRAHFVTHSFGGLVALNLACLDPGRITDLVIADSHISEVRRSGRKHRWPLGEKVQNILDRNGLDIDVKEPHFGYRLLTALAHMHMKNIRVSPELEDLVSRLMWTNNKRTARQWVRLQETTTAGEELMDDGLSLESLMNLRFPILAMYGEQSHAMSTGVNLRAVWPHADFRIVPGAGHFFPVTRPADFIENCTDFWDCQAAAGYECEKEVLGKR